MNTAFAKFATARVVKTRAFYCANVRCICVYRDELPTHLLSRVTMTKYIWTPSGAENLPDLIEFCKKRPGRFDRAIRRIARYGDEPLAAKKRRRLWYFSDCNNTLRSPEWGLDELEALDFLFDWITGDSDFNDDNLLHEEIP